MMTESTYASRQLDAWGAYSHEAQRQLIGCTIESLRAIQASKTAHDLTRMAHDQTTIATRLLASCEPLTTDQRRVATEAANLAQVLSWMALERLVESL